MTKIIWGTKIYNVLEIKILKEPNKFSMPEYISIVFKSDEVLSDLRKMKLQRILSIKENNILFRSPLYIILSDDHGYIYRKILAQPNDVSISSSYIFIISNLWVEKWD